MEEIDVTKQPIPALFEQCLEVYEAMTDQASMQQAYMDIDAEFLVYEGFLTRLITQDLHYSTPYYTKLTKRLKAMRCIHQVKRGGSTTPSRWALLKTPTLDDFVSASTEKGAKTYTVKENLEQQIRDLNERLNRAGL